MPFEGRKKDNLTILEDIYNDNTPIKSDKTQIKEFFNDSNNIEKLLSATIIFVGLGAMVLGLFQIKDGVKIKRPLAKNTNTAIATHDPNDLLGLKTKDTDQDGLTDYDEMYIYKTSAYLKDSDSDNINDKIEVTNGSDPVCPQGDNCFAQWSDLYKPTPSPLESDASGTDALAQAQTMDIAQLRELLIQAGMTETQLNSLSDEEIITAFNQVVGNGAATNPSVNSITNLPAITTQDSQTQTAAVQQGADSVLLNQISSMTPVQIRQLLAQEGSIPKETLDQIPDDEIMKLVQETIASNPIQ